MGNPDLSPRDTRGLVIFPADLAASGPGREDRNPGEWWLVPAAIAVAGLLIAIAFLIR